MFICNLFFFFFFFFSSRRRHTRCLSDWSSDVCSSDLADRAENGCCARFQHACRSFRRNAFAVWLNRTPSERASVLLRLSARCENERSEERRVGKECRSRRLRYEEKKK